MPRNLLPPLRQVIRGLHKRLNIEALECRMMRAAFVVNAADDLDDGLCDENHCSLREAIAAANADMLLDEIHFNITAAGVPTIQPTSQLTLVTEPVVIDGSTQPGGLVEIDGSLAGPDTDALHVEAGGSTIRGLVINRYDYAGLHLFRGGGNTIEGCLVGTDVTGTVALGNRRFGIVVQDSPNNVIGGTTPGTRNLISGNGFDGLLIFGGESTGNVVVGNFLGTDATGTVDLGNGFAGVGIVQAHNNIVGGLTPETRNVISGNDTSGVAIVTGSTGNVVAGNFIGTDVTGTIALGNANDGVLIRDSERNDVGGVDPGAGNLLSGNGFDGLQITGASSSANVVQGNLIGTDLTGTVAVGNLFHGVFVNDAPRNLIGVVENRSRGGGPQAEIARNIISGNRFTGVFLNQAGATANTIRGNWIGTDASGLQSLGNGGDGITIQDAPGNFVGGIGEGSGNVISANAGTGIQLFGVGATENLIEGNLIGTDRTGTIPMGNSASGILMEAGAARNTVGGSMSGARNVISSNGAAGIFIARNEGGSVVQGNLIGTDFTGTQPLGNNNGVLIVESPNNLIGGAELGEGNVISASTQGNGVMIAAGANGPGGGNIVQGNLIGTDITGHVRFGNRAAGVTIDSSPRNVIGGTAPGARNVISANGTDGVQIFRDPATGNVVQGNFIGTDITGTVGLGNGLSGVNVEAGNNTIGGDSLGAGNVISNNSDVGVAIEPNANGTNAVQGNRIGTDVSGTLPLGNGSVGVLVRSSNHIIGGFVPGAGNTIAFNGREGIAVVPTLGNAVGNGLLGNAIHSNVQLGIDLGIFDGVTLNDRLDADPGANTLQNFPVLTAAIAGRGSIGIRGRLNSLPETHFFIQVFASPGRDPSGHGEGERFLGVILVETNRRGQAAIRGRLLAQAFPGEFITALATNAATNDTSEFSNAIVAIDRLEEEQNGEGRGAARVAAPGRRNSAGAAVQVFEQAGNEGQASVLLARPAASQIDAAIGELLTRENGTRLLLRKMAESPR